MTSTVTSVQVKQSVILYLICMSVTLATAALTTTAGYDGWIDGGNFRENLNAMKDQGLGVERWQEYFDTLEFAADIPNGQTLLDNLVDKLSNKFSQRITELLRIKSVMEANYANFRSWGQLRQCCQLSELFYDERFKMKVSLTDGCEQISSTAKSEQKHINNAVLELMKDNLDRDSSLKWQYYGDESGVMTMYPANKFTDCGSYDPRYRPWYVAAATPTKKEVVIVIDTSGSMYASHNGKSLMEIAKEAAITVLKTLGPDDLVAVVAFSSSEKTPSGCFSNSMALATPQSIEKLAIFVESLYDSGSTSYVRGLKKAFELLRTSDATFSGETREKVILFLSDGVPDESSYEIMDEIRTQNAALSNRVIILTYGLGRSLPSSARTILERMANQDMYDSNAGYVMSGIFEHISDPSKLRSSMASYYNFFSKAADGGKATVSVPYFDAFGLGMITTVSIPVYNDNDLKGVIGIDIPLSDLFSEAIFNRHYVFVTDNKGRTIIHPLLPQPDNVSQTPIVASIETLEQNPAVSSVISSMKSGNSGVKNFLADHIITQGDALRDGVIKQSLSSSYYWKSVPDSGYSVCLVMINGDVEPSISLPSPPSSSFWYHRIDKRPTSPRCEHFGRVSSMVLSVVKFSAECFEEPFRYLDGEEDLTSIDNIFNYMAFVTDSNPGFKSDIRSTVTMLEKANNIWLTHLTDMAKFLAWRYIATYNGVFRVIPGVTLDKKYNPVQRPWYRRAISQPGKTVLSTPYLDAFGAGYVVTMSYTLFKGDSLGVHSSTDTVVAVVGADFTIGYFYQTVISRFPKCTETNYRCYLIDTSGYLVIHEDFVQGKKASSFPEIEYVHITYKDNILAEHLISANYMTRQSCLDVADMKEQSTWKVDLGGHSMVEFNDPFSSYHLTYQVSVVPGSNVFIVVEHNLNGNADHSPCPCSSKSIDSVKDYTCSYTGLTCECPCRDDASYQICEDKMIGGSATNPPCTPEVPQLDIKPPSDSERADAEKLSACFQNTCSSISDKSYCMSLIGCSWCALTSEGDVVDEPFCGTQEKCYLGVIGMPNPYDKYKNDDDGPGDDFYYPNDNDSALYQLVMIGVACLVVLGAVSLIAYRCHVKKQRQRRAQAQNSRALDLQRQNYSGEQSRQSAPGSQQNRQHMGHSPRSPEPQALPYPRQPAAQAGYPVQQVVHPLPTGQQIPPSYPAPQYNPNYIPDQFDYQVPQVSVPSGPQPVTYQGGNITPSAPPATGETPPPSYDFAVNQHYNPTQHSPRRY